MELLGKDVFGSFRLCHLDQIKIETGDNQYLFEFQNSKISRIN